MGCLDPKAEWDKFHLKTYRFNAEKHSTDNCQICQVAKWTPIGKKNISPNMKPNVAMKGEKVLTPSKNKIQKKLFQLQAGDRSGNPKQLHTQ